METDIPTYTPKYIACEQPIPLTKNWNVWGNQLYIQEVYNVCFWLLKALVEGKPQYAKALEARDFWSSLQIEGFTFNPEKFDEFIGKLKDQSKHPKTR